MISNYSGLNSSRPEAEVMLGMHREGHHITIMTPEGSEYIPVFENAGIRVIRFRTQKKFGRKEISFIRRELIDGKFDVLHLFNGKAIINGIRAARRLPVKVVLYRGYCGNIHWWDPMAYFKYLHPRVDGIWCIAPAVADLINRNTLFTRKKAFCVAKGHDPAWYSQIKKGDLPSLGVGHSAFCVTMVANARRMKGLKYLLKATYLKELQIPIYIILIGRGLNSGKAGKLAARSPMSERIIFTGYRSDSLELVKASQLFVLSSIYGEAICKSVIEAMSCGIPSVITDIPGNRGLVVDRQNGLVVPRKNPQELASAIAELYHHPDMLELYAQNAPQHIAQHYHIRQTIVHLLEQYRKLCAAD